MRRDEIRALIADPAIGRRGFVDVLADLVEGRDGTGRETKKLRPEEVSFQDLWEAMVGPVSETLDISRRGHYVEIQEAVESTMFPSATGLLIAAKVIEGYNIEGMIGDQLVTNMPSRLKSERIVGFTSLEGPLEVPEGMPYEESTFGEKFVTTEAAKKGRILEITEEAIYFDQTGQILMRAQRLGEQTRQERELTILSGVVDVGSGAAGFKDVYRPNGVPTPLYSTGNTNYLSTVTPLTDWQSIDGALQYHAENVVDDRANPAERLPIVWMPRVMLVARKKLATAARVVNATEVRSGNITSGDGTQITTVNPVQQLVPGMKILSSPLLDFLANVQGSRYNDSDDWFMGDPQRQFIWQEIWPIQTMRSFQDDEARFRRDILARFKVRYFGGLSAVDRVNFIKINAA